MILIQNFKSKKFFNMIKILFLNKLNTCNAQIIINFNSATIIVLVNKTDVKIFIFLMVYVNFKVTQILPFNNCHINLIK